MSRGALAKLLDFAIVHQLSHVELFTRRKP